MRPEAVMSGDRGRRAAPGEPHRILYVCHTLAVGGAEELVSSLMRRLPRDEWDPRVLCIGEPGPVGREIEAAGLPLTALGRVPGIRDPLAVLAIAREIRRLGPDVVHTLLLTGNLYGRLAARLAGVPVVISSEVNVRTDRQRRHVIAERLLARVTDHVIASAEAVKVAHVREIGVAATRVTVVPSAVDWAQLAASRSREQVRREHGLDAAAVVGGVVARLTPQKGHAVLLDAVASAPELRSLTLLLVGDGPLRGELEARARALGLADRVRFLGARRDLGDLLSAMDLFVLPSRWEGLPLSLILAMGAGLPVIATSVAGVPEVVQDGVTGVLVPPDDSFALAKALSALVEDAFARERLGRAAEAHVRDRYGIERYVDSVADVYRSCLQTAA